MVRNEIIRDYFSKRIAQHGASPKGVDWNTSDAQELRFAQLLKVVDKPGRFSITDWGCGYGGLLDYLTARTDDFDFVGFDITPDVLSEARKAHPNAANATWVGRVEDLKATDYVVAGGVYNIKFDTAHGDWQKHVLEQLTAMFAFADRAMAATFLTSYSDPPKQRPDLYYANPLEFFDFAKRTLSPNVAVLHDYGHWDFTLIVRKVATT
jgi:SAM-dependent methyltransferase